MDQEAPPGGLREGRVRHETLRRGPDHPGDDGEVRGRQRPRREVVPSPTPRGDISGPGEEDRKDVLGTL